MSSLWAPTTMKKHLRDCRNRIDALVRDLSRLELTLERYPDIGVWHTSKGEPQYFSASVNPSVVHFDCDQDWGIVLAWPYLLLNGLKIFSWPSNFQVGQPYYTGKGIVRRHEWRQEMEAAGINAVVIDEIDSFLSKNKPQD